MRTLERPETIQEPPVVARTPLAVPPVEVDERAARRTLREQIARLEARLSHVTASDEAWGGVELPPRVRGAGPELLSLGELERARDELSESVARASAQQGARSEVFAANRRLLEAMMREPARYKFMRITREDLGERACGGWEVRPRLGIIGMLAGWWHVVISSGCPLPMGYQHRRQQSWGRNARLEMVLTALVMVLLVGVVLLFLLVYHDFPLRPF